MQAAKLSKRAIDAGCLRKTLLERSHSWRLRLPPRLSAQWIQCCCVWSIPANHRSKEGLRLNDSALKISKCFIFKRNWDSRWPNALFSNESALRITNCFVPQINAKVTQHLTWFKISRCFVFNWIEPSGSLHALIFYDFRCVSTTDRTQDLQTLCFRMNWACELRPVDHQIHFFRMNSKVSQHLTEFKISKCVVVQWREPCGSPRALFSNDFEGVST